MNYPIQITNLIESFQKLPGVGPKTAERLALYVVTNMQEDDALLMSKALIAAKRELMFCDVCGYVTDVSPCSICTDTNRDRTILCVVEESRDVMAMERMGQYHGLYHVLGGALSPIDGIGPEDLLLTELIQRLKDEPDISEIIIATNPNMEGETTAQYIRRLLETTDIRLSRIAHGLPVGGDLEYVDEATLLKAIEGRREMK
ncbi:recombination mediator RecR [Culicoidibacter larvae]|uniref:Recombination protein RecR n=1 Tax=Culicoidibacter larvae TaxID=2579976 RepID=A0A5R8QGN3_9FIRM|nr:recombination mediator RecR [Culicoidibacter larvae]TLG77199.1 recombination protein RecR [Culicoidibacter larvae]